MEILEQFQRLRKSPGAIPVPSRIDPIEEPSPQKRAEPEMR